jgi:hypothetical protein
MGCEESSYEVGTRSLFNNCRRDYAILEPGETRHQEWRRGQLMRKKPDLRPGRFEITGSSLLG